MSFAMAHLLSLPYEEVATPAVFTPRSLEVALNPLTVSAPPSKLTLRVSLPSRFVPLYPAVLARVSICVRSPSYCTARSLRAEVTVIIYCYMRVDPLQQTVPVIALSAAAEWRVIRLPLLTAFNVPGVCSVSSVRVDLGCEVGGNFLIGKMHYRLLS